MKKKYFFTAFAAALLFAGFAFTACDDDDDNSAPGTKPTIKFENVIPTKNYVQSGTFAAVAPGATTSFTFHAAKGQRLMFATMYSYSNDLFFAPENPGIALFNDSGVPYTGVIANAVKLWDNGTRVNEQPGPNVNHPGVAQAGVVSEVNGTDTEGHTYPAASSLLQVSLTFDAVQSLFTCTISNISNGTSNETPFSGGRSGQRRSPEVARSRSDGNHHHAARRHRSSLHGQHQPDLSAGTERRTARSGGSRTARRSGTAESFARKSPAGAQDLHDYEDRPAGREHGMHL